MQIPPELMTAEQREERAAELERAIGREWIRYVIADAAILVPLTVVLAVGVWTDAIPDSAIVPIAVVGGVLCGVLITYWMLARIRPLQLQREQIEQLHDT